ncbi:hypothetical protein [Mesorhizobium sp. GR13]|uniref:hypothetical protein n=1 Tax=Mesorhizobium sp. GR13 TaxID=2562308 RepID=UPI0010C09B1E|nr:hypothetical protein [Mesorhizobium sp. GR13]
MSNATALIADETRRPYTTKQIGDATEMLVAAELTLAGIPAIKVPDMWPGYDIIAQPAGLPLQRISVKARTHKKANYITYNCRDQFDWLAVVLLMPQCGRRSVFIIPRPESDLHARRDKETSKTANLRYFTAEEIERKFARFEANFILSETGKLFRGDS